jgi:SAM-dependent MidA family methyltransferase
LSGSRAGDIPGGVAQEIAAEGGRVTVARFMGLALTHPTDGYYSRAGTLLGARGHFSTAPCLSPQFNEAVSGLLEELVVATAASVGEGATPVLLVELGGGRGDLATAVMRTWERERPEFRDRVVYTIVEVGEGLRAQQRRSVAPLMKRGRQVRWAATVGEALAEGASAGMSAGPPAVVVGNEFLDALPVHLVDVRGDEPLEAWVEIDPAGEADSAPGPREVWGTLAAEAKGELQALFGTVETAELRPHSRDGIIEVRPSVRSLLEQVAAGGAARCLLTVDYGEWFGSGSGGGGSSPPAGATPYRRTLRGYFRHQMVTDPYVRVGRQDLTADVDFRALDLHGRSVGFETVLFTTVAGLLRGNAGEDELRTLRRQAEGSLTADRQATILATMLNEDELGGAFKVMLQVRE